ncbi:MAG: ribonuclease HI family protein [Desulfobacterota bacterium]|nr:ribonuclease HI family protein [Thermodesulfobacteriota bacterium]
MPKAGGKTRERIEELFIFIDGASKGNPGRAAAGVYITDREGNAILKKGKFLGHRTNNEAEYEALLLGMEEARKLGGRTVSVYTDSELVQRQVEGLYRVREPHLMALHAKVMERKKAFETFRIESIPREENQEADLQANLALRKGFQREKRKGGIGRE